MTNNSNRATWTGILILGALMDIELPNGWEPRAYQLPLWEQLERGCKRAVAVWHRRAGKDSLSLNWTAVAMHQRKAVYWHMLPEARQARKVVWDGIDKFGRRMIDQAFPPALRTKTNDQEMKIELKCGSIWQCVGSDNYDSLVGTNPAGIVFSEFALADPKAWDYLRPILAENGGWALFIYTPRGKGHGYDLFEMARKNPEWYCSRLGYKDTQPLGGTIAEADVQRERDSGMSPQMIAQEYDCSFESSNEGSYYGPQVEALERATPPQVCSVPYEPSLPVGTAWDLGVGDDLSMWFYQQAGKELRLIDFLSEHGKGLDYYAKRLKEKPYCYSEHLLPHDINVRELSTGRRRLDMLKSLQIGKIRVVPKLPIDDGIQAVRALLPRCWFDYSKCADGLKALKSYHREYDERKMVWGDAPVHDWSSNPADAFRYLALGMKIARDDSVVRKTTAVMEWNEFG